MIIRTLLALLLVGVIFIGVFICFIGYEAVSTGINPRPWWTSLIVLVVVPVVLLVIVVWPGHRSPKT